MDNIEKELKKLADTKYKEFHSKLCPNTDNILGVRIPVLKAYSKKLFKENPNINVKEIGNKYYEQIMLQGLIIGLKKLEFKELKKEIEEFVPKIYNWAICDTFCAGLKMTKKCKEQINNMNPIITTNINNMTDKFLFGYPILKKDKKLVAFFNDFINKELTQCYPLFFDAIILLENKKIFDNLKKLFFEPDWLKVDKTPVTFRLELKKYCYQLYQLSLIFSNISNLPLLVPLIIIFKISILFVNFKIFCI